MTNTKRGFGLVLLTMLIDVAAMGMLIPVLPGTIVGLVGGDLATAAWLGGSVATLSAALSLFSAPILGSLSDRFGRRPILVLGLAGPAVTYLALALTPSVGWLIAGFALTGVLGAIQATTTAYVADITTPEDRAARFGMIGAAFGLGFVLGPVVGGLLGGIAQSLPFLVAASITVLNLLLVVVAMPESLSVSKRRRFTLRGASPIAPLSLLARSRVLRGLAIAYLLTNVANHALYNTFVFSTTARFGWSDLTTGVIFAVMGLAVAVAQGTVVGPIVKRLGERRSILLGLATSALAFVGYAVAPSTWAIVAVIVIAAFGAMDEPAAQSMLSREVGEDEQGALQGALTSVMSLAAVIGPMVGSATFGYFVSGAAPVFLPGAPFLASAVLAVAALLIVWRYVRPSEAHVPAGNVEDSAKELVEAA